jgi:hypothetical protein
MIEMKTMQLLLLRMMRQQPEFLGLQETQRSIPLVLVVRRSLDFAV